MSKRSGSGRGSTRRTSGGTPATVALTRSGVPFTLHPYEHEAGAGSYGQAAADALGVAPGRVFKTLVAELDRRLVVGIVPVDRRLDLKGLARALSGSRAVLADAVVAERATGYVTGGISPLGQRRSHPTVLDTAAWEHATVLVSGGRPGLEIELSPAGLVALTDATTAPISR